MKNIVSTIIVFGTVFILIIAGAFIFDKFNGFGLIDNVDSSLNNGIKKVLESEDDNTDDNNKFDEIKDNTVTNNYIKIIFQIIQQMITAVKIQKLLLMIIFHILIIHQII